MHPFHCPSFRPFLKGLNSSSGSAQCERLPASVFEFIFQLNIVSLKEQTFASGIRATGRPSYTIAGSKLAYRDQKCLSLAKVAKRFIRVGRDQGKLRCEFSPYNSTNRCFGRSNVITGINSSGAVLCGQLPPNPVPPTCPNCTQNTLSSPLDCNGCYIKGIEKYEFCSERQTITTTCGTDTSINTIYTSKNSRLIPSSCNFRHETPLGPEYCEPLIGKKYQDYKIEESIPLCDANSASAGDTCTNSTHIEAREVGLCPNPCTQPPRIERTVTEACPLDNPPGGHFSSLAVYKITEYVGAFCIPRVSEGLIGLSCPHRSLTDPQCPEPVVDIMSSHTCGISGGQQRVEVKYNITQTYGPQCNQTRVIPSINYGPLCP